MMALFNIDFCLFTIVHLICSNDNNDMFVNHLYTLNQTYTLANGDSARREYLSLKILCSSTVIMEITHLSEIHENTLKMNEMNYSDNVLSWFSRGTRGIRSIPSRIVTLPRVYHIAESKYFYD